MLSRDVQNQALSGEAQYLPAGAPVLPAMIECSRGASGLERPLGRQIKTERGLTAKFRTQLANAE